MESDLISTILELRKDIKDINEYLRRTPKWIAVAEVARELGLTAQAVRKRLLNGDFEPGVDFKYVGSRILIARSTVPYLVRRRK